MPTAPFSLNERDGKQMAIVQMEIRIGQRNLICIAHEEENQRVIRAFLKCATLNQIRLVDIRAVTLNEGNGIPF